MKGEMIGLGDMVLVMDEFGRATSQRGIIVAELTREQVDACNAAAQILDAKTVWPGNVRVFVVFTEPGERRDDQDPQRLQIYCDAFLSVLQTDYSRN